MLHFCKMRWRTPLLPAAVLAMAAVAAWAQDGSPPPPPARAEARSGPVRAYVGVCLLGIRNLESAAGTFDADFNLWVRYRAAPDVDLAGLSLVNGRAEHQDLIEKREAGPWTRLLWRVTGTFRDDFQLENFPFDRQKLSIAIQHPGLSADELVLEPDLEGTSVAPGLEIPGWSYERHFGAHSSVVELSPRFGGQSGARSQVHFSIYIQRPVMSLLAKILIPLIVVLSMSHGSFWIEPTDVSSRLILVTTAIFVASTVHYALSHTIPDTNYLTIADIYFAMVYGFLFVELIASIASHILVRRDHPVAIARLDQVVRWLLPAIFLGAAVATTWTAAGQRVSDRPAPAGGALAVKSVRPELAIGIMRKPGQLGPRAETVVDKFLTRLVLAPLVELDDRGRPHAVMAGEVPSFANGRLRLGDDGSTAVLWPLRRGRWGDGSPVVEEDVVRENVLAGRYTTFRGARSVAPKDGEVLVEYEGVRRQALFDTFLFPHRALDGLDDEARKRVLTRDLPPLSGPFVLEGFDGETIRLVRNRHHEPPAALERITVRTFPDKNALLGAFRRGDVQLVLPGDVDLETALALAAEVKGATAAVFDAPYVWHLDVNLDDPLLRDREVRRALFRAIDREAIVREVLGGHGKVAHSWLSPLHPARDPKIPTHPFDPAGAEAALAKLGFTRGIDSKLRDPSGAPVKFKIARADRHPTGMGEVIARSWNALGIEVEDDAHEYLEYMQVYTTQLRWPHFSFWGYNILPYETGRVYWVEDTIPRAENGWRGLNFNRWREPRVNELYARIERTFNPDDLADLLAEQQRIFAEELPAFMLYTGEQAILLGPGLAGVRPHAAGEPMIGWNAAEWRFSQ